ncbi:hypothetical protein ABMA27_016810 [Loxostege sticticalis]|uniref:RNase H type-1 domain-containing protein n=1 Tax=Loxostege sticticalis TaxID=481309 RepID=A0ABR3I3T3_LOXSC
MTVELVAILEALKYIESQNLTECVILTDSKSALQHVARCASGYSRGAPIAYDVLKMIRRLDNDRGINLRLQWVPSHVGLSGNEEADRLAKLACTTGINFSIVPFYTEILPKFRKSCYTKFKEYFDKRSVDKGICRKHIVILHRLRSGHFPSNKFAFLMRKAPSPNCDVCGTLDDVQHILVECEKYRGRRSPILQKFNINMYDVGAFIEILADPTSQAAKCLAEMILNR